MVFCAGGGEVNWTDIRDAVNSGEDHVGGLSFMGRNWTIGLARCHDRVNVFDMGEWPPKGPPNLLGSLPMVLFKDKTPEVSQVAVLKLMCAEVSKTDPEWKCVK